MSAGHWNGMAPDIENVLNACTEALKMFDDPVLSLLVEALLGWIWKVDNISLSTSRIAPDNSVLGPHPRLRAEDGSLKLFHLKE